jgi:hypothetical protein
MDLAPLTTSAKTGLFSGLLGLHLSPGLQALLAQLSGKLAHFPDSIGASSGSHSLRWVSPVSWAKLSSSLAIATVRISWNTGFMAASLLVPQHIRFYEL